MPAKCPPPSYRKSKGCWSCGWCRTDASPESIMYWCGYKLPGKPPDRFHYPHNSRGFEPFHAALTAWEKGGTDEVLAAIVESVGICDKWKAVCC